MYSASSLDFIRRGGHHGTLYNFLSEGVTVQSEWIQNIFYNLRFYPPFAGFRLFTIMKTVLRKRILFLYLWDLWTWGLFKQTRNEEIPWIFPFYSQRIAEIPWIFFKAVLEKRFLRDYWIFFLKFPVFRVFRIIFSLWILTLY